MASLTINQPMNVYGERLESLIEKQKNSLEYNNLNGKVKSVTEYLYGGERTKNGVEKNAEFYRKFEIQFNEDGNITEIKSRVLLDNAGSLFGEEINRLAKGPLDKISEDESDLDYYARRDKELKEETSRYWEEEISTFTYNSAKQCTEIAISTKKDGEEGNFSLRVFRYNNQGYLVSEIDEGDNIQGSFKYESDESGRVICIVDKFYEKTLNIVYEDKKITYIYSSIPHGKKEYVEEYRVEGIFNEQGLIVEQTTYKPKKSFFSTKLVKERSDSFEYDEDSNLQSTRTVCYENGKITDEYETSVHNISKPLSYDEKNNWTLKTKTHDFDSLMVGVLEAQTYDALDVIVREFEYYD